MANDTNYFRLGLFILLGMGLIAGTLVVLGAGELFQSTMPAETYFNESVQGLDVGAPVKFRGVKIGTVAHIGFLPEKYPEITGPARRYVLVEMNLYEDLSMGMSLQRLQGSMAQEISQGLRIRLTTQGLTGVAYLEINYLDPQFNPTLPMDWEHEDLYIPSAPSTLSRVEQAINNISEALGNIKTIDFKQMADSLGGLFNTIDSTLHDIDVEGLGEQLAGDLAALRTALDRVNVILAEPSIDTLIPDAAQALAGVGEIVQNSKGDIMDTMRQLRGATAELEQASQAASRLLTDPGLQSAVNRMPLVMENLGLATDDIRRSSVSLDRLLANLNDLLVGQRATIEAILENTRVLVDNLSELSGDAKQNPSRLIFGNPPAPIDTRELQ